MITFIYIALDLSSINTLDIKHSQPELFWNVAESSEINSMLLYFTVSASLLQSPWMCLAPSAWLTSCISQVPAKNKAIYEVI